MDQFTTWTVINVATRSQKNNPGPFFNEHFAYKNEVDINENKLWCMK